MDGGAWWATESDMTERLHFTVLSFMWKNEKKLSHLGKLCLIIGWLLNVSNAEKSLIWSFTKIDFKNLT